MLWSRISQTIRGASVVALAVLAAGARADQAVVVGINEYPALNANLHGCVNDATAMAAALKRYGFAVTLLSDSQATKAGILQAVAALKSVNAAERVVVYFAGHGSQATSNTSVLLPFDAQPQPSASDITQDELFTAVNALPARSKTIIMDSCFSGGMMRSLARRHLTTRYFPRETERAKDLVRVNRQDINPVVPGAGSVCYFAATQPNQQAAEDDFDGTQDGVFTHYLTQRLTGKAERWEDIQQDVVAKVQEHLDMAQKPLLTERFKDLVVFEGGASPAPVPPPAPARHTVWEQYNGGSVDPKLLLLAMSVNRSPLRVGDHFTMRAAAGRQGYLVVVELGVSGHMNLLYPEKPSAEAAKVEAGQTIAFPADQDFMADRPGLESVRALLFPSPDLAQHLLQLFANGGSIALSSFERAAQRDLVRVPRDITYYASDATFEVAEGAAKGN